MGTDPSPLLAPPARGETAPAPEPAEPFGPTSADGRGAAAIEFERVSKVYPGGVAALRDVSLRIVHGEFVFIVGRTGVGKSTLLKMIYREEQPTDGRVLVHGTDVTALRRSEVPFLRRRLGVVFQDFRLLPDQSAWRNVAFALEVTGVAPDVIPARVDEALGLVGLSARADARPSQLSAGEQQRVSIARALVRTPSVLLADEPTGNLDPESSGEIAQLLLRIHERATTVVVATHDQAMVDALRRRVVALQDGAVVRDDPEGAYAAS